MLFFTEFSKHVTIKRHSVYVDNLIFRLYYRLTFFILVGCTILVCTRHYVKEHIACTGYDHKQKKLDAINTFCFISTTFTVPKYVNSSVGGLAAHPGVGPHVKDDEVRYHSYYQWVPFVLFIQALLFYFPHALWKSLEGRRIEGFVGALEQMVEGKIQPSLQGKMKHVRTTFQSLLRFRVNRDWAMKLVLCELLNFLLLIFQIYITDLFLQKQFLKLGFYWFTSESDKLLNNVFPKVTKCTFYKYGPAGSLQSHDYLCVLPINLFNVWIYGCLWYWFATLFFISCIGLVWRLLSYILHSSIWFSQMVWGEVSPGRRLKYNDVELVATHLIYSDWLFLYYIAKNVSSKKFREFFHTISEDIKRKNSLFIDDHEISFDDSKDAGESNC